MKALGEFDLIARLAARLPAAEAKGIVGIGDDAAAVPFADGVLLLTCDIVMEGRHFERGRTPMADLGWKVASSSVSDVVACGGQASHALISLSVPADMKQGELDALYDGIGEAAAHYGFSVLGGNVSGGEVLMVDCFMTGHAPAFIPRSGARCGDVLWVSGTLGDSAAGLELLGSPGGTEAEQVLRSRHLRPRARTDLLSLLRQTAHAAIDISDSLAAELHHMAAASGVRLVIEGERLPISSELRAFAHARGEDPQQRALFGGEDYQLLFSAPEGAIKDGEAHLTRIGKVHKGSGVLLSAQPLPNKGWDHLRIGKCKGGNSLF